MHRQLRVKPDDTSALVNEGIILLQLGGYSNAIPPLTRVLALTNSPLAIFNRAVAYLRLSNLDAAQTDSTATNLALKRAHRPRGPLRTDVFLQLANAYTASVLARCSPSR